MPGTNRAPAQIVQRKLSLMYTPLVAWLQARVSIRSFRIEFAPEQACKMGAAATSLMVGCAPLSSAISRPARSQGGAASPSLRVVENDPGGIALSRTQPAHAVAHGDAIGAARALDRPMVHREDHAFA